MPTPIETVTAFCAEMSKGKEGSYNSIRTWFTPDTVWENVGLATTTGIDEALALVDQLEATMDVTSVTIEMLTITQIGNKVLTERMDRMLRADGSEIWAAPVMGIFEVDGERILAWRDYFNSADALRRVK